MIKIKKKNNNFISKILDSFACKFTTCGQKKINFKNKRKNQLFMILLKLLLLIMFLYILALINYKIQFVLYIYLIKPKIVIHNCSNCYLFVKLLKFKSS